MATWHPAEKTSASHCPVQPCFATALVLLGAFVPIQVPKPREKLQRMVQEEQFDQLKEQSLVFSLWQGAYLGAWVLSSKHLLSPASLDASAHSAVWVTGSPEACGCLYPYLFTCAGKSLHLIQLMVCSVG